jgi:imidazolonepropionase-like amidohydrolase
MIHRIALRFAALAACVYLAPAVGQELLIEHVTVISAERPQPLADSNVLVRDGRIVSVSTQTPAISPKTVRLDGTGKFLTPGLMDSHVHVSEVPGINFGPNAQLEPLRAAYFRQQPRSYLYFGVTQLLDPANRPEEIATFRAQPEHPDLFRCGAAPVLNGYPAVFAPVPVRYRLMPDYIFEPANKDALPKGADPAAHTPEAVVARIAASGALCVKIFIEDGFADASIWPILSPATIRRVRDAAHQRGLILMAHANALDMQRIAIEAQVDVLAHGLWNWTHVKDISGVPEPIATHLRKVHELKIGWQPTMRVMAGTQELFVPGTLDNPEYRKVVPKALLDWYRTDAGQWFKQEMRKEYGGAPDEKIARGQWEAEEMGMRATRYLYELGHPLLLGSDTPSAPTYGNQPGYDTYREMQLMAKAGIPLKGIFEAATINNARQFRLDKDYGTVEPHKIANLLLLDANPLENLDAFNRIDKIILRGKVLARADLAADAAKQE